MSATTSERDTPEARRDDRLVRDQVMITIGALMPQRSWGMYEARIAASGESPA
jgi:hypothetical protein